jgi:adenylate cyclase, class 2
MSQKHTETEVKYRVDSLSDVENRLRELGAKLTAERVYENNVRYEDATNSLSANKRVLRMRQDTRARLTYKEPGSSQREGLASRTELEIEVSDFETADLLLQKLGFHPSWIYEKYRTTYEMDDCEIVLDETPLGQFIEIEGDADSIDKMVKMLGLEEAQPIIESYSDLFFKVKAYLQLDVRDMTFENFKGIEIPESLM